MKKFDLFLVFCLVLLLTACGTSTEESKQMSERFTGSGSTSGIEIFKDEETDCKYMLYRTGYAMEISPLYKSNGEIDCGE